MNERIKQFAELSGFKVDWQHEDVQALKMARFEKFAELIVRECANHCDLLLDHKISSEWSRGTHDCSRAIKEHFGVEE